MDVQPIATKEGDAILGEGATRVLDGVVMMLTGTDEGGVQIGEFGSSEGYMDENIMWGRPGCPDKGEIFIKGNIVVQARLTWSVVDLWLHIQHLISLHRKSVKL